MAKQRCLSGLSRNHEKSQTGNYRLPFTPDDVKDVLDHANPAWFDDGTLQDARSFLFLYSNLYRDAIAGWS